MVHGRDRDDQGGRRSRAAGDAGDGRPSRRRDLQPIFARHDRSQHSERRALLRVLKVLQYGDRDHRDASGSVRLFSCHTPCLSCLFVFAQFRAMFPKIRLTVAFTSWTETKAILKREQKDVLDIAEAFALESWTSLYVETCS